MEKLRLDLINGPDGAAPEEEEEYDLSFYEDIEAPKYVDFTAPDLSRLDDRSWFCVRIGCDQNHDEVDPDELYRRFVLRVMSARSPNVRLRRKLDQKASSSIAKCPHTAPAKEAAKSRMERLSTMTSFPDKMAKTKLKEHPISSLRSAPRQVKAKYLCPTTEKAFTTPRKKKCSPNGGDQFRSVKYHKAPAGGFKSKNVAKVLFKDTTKETSETSDPVKSQIPVSEVCTEMKKLKITCHKKIVPSRYLSTSTTPRSSKKPEVDKEHLKITEESTMNLKLRKTSSKVSVKVESSGNSSDQAIVAADVEEVPPASATTTSKSLQPTTLAGAGTSSSSRMEQNREKRGENEDLLMKKMQPGSTITAMSQTSTNNKSTSSRTVQNGEEKSTEKEASQVQPRSMPAMSQYTANTLELDENKENSPDMDGTRETEPSTRNCRNEILQHLLPKAHKPQNKSSNVACNQGGKNKRTTNPKPFRFRTDERGILKERNIEKRLNVKTHKVAEPLPRLGERVKQAGTFANAEDQKIVLQEGTRNALQDQASVHVVSGRPTKTKFTGDGSNSHKVVNGKQIIAEERVNKLQVAPLSTNCRKGTISCVKTKKNEASIAVSSKGKRPVTVPREPRFHRIHHPKDCSKKEE